MKNASIIKGLLALTLALFSADAVAQGIGGGNGGGQGPGGNGSCDSVLIRLNQTRSMVYDPADQVRRGVEVQLSSDNPGQRLDCDLDSVILSQTTPQPLAFVGPTDILMTQQVRDPSFAYRQQNFSLSGSALSALERGETLRFNLVEPNTGQFVDPGSYLLPFNVLVNGAAATSAELLIEVIPRVIVFGKSRKVTTLDFGELETGETKQSVVMVKSNAQLRVYAASDNNGELKHETIPSAPGVPYTAFLDGQLLDLNSGTPQEVEDGPGQGDPQISKLLVRIGDVSSARYAGVYKDVLTLNFMAY